MKLVIKGTLPGLNEYIQAERTNKYVAARIKDEYQGIIMTYIKKCLGSWKPRTPVWMHYTWYEKDRRRDKDNVSFARKFIQDALVKARTLPNDGWKEIEGFDDTFLVDAKNPRIEVEIVEYGDIKQESVGSGEGDCRLLQ
ncbi:MAG: hypothetical protein J6V52_04245 [Bacteroidaceae bacterium]|nr:hypothetical protein [Bacteroidaceae bacterium]